MKRRSIFLVVCAALFVGCQPQGPAERAGESIDNAARDVKDAVTTDGPIERAGEKIDNAVNK